MAQVLLDTHGSGGDINPFLAVGIGMRRRGHAVTLISNERFEPAARQAGVGFAATSSSDQFDAALQRQSSTDKLKGIAVLKDYLTVALEREVTRIEECHRAGETVIVASRLAFGGLIAGEHLKIPVAALLLNTTSLRSTHEPPIIPGVPRIPRVPGRRLLLKLVYHWRDGRALAALSGSINSCRARLGLAPVRNLIQWVNSPKLLIAAWPEWLYKHQRDWPLHVITAGFLDYDGQVANSEPMKTVLSARSDEVGAIAFTAGTLAVREHRFFAAAAEACRLMGRRGKLITEYAAQVPAHLPGGVSHVSYQPFSELLPTCAAIVHRGGIGTCARSLKAGIPQVIVPTVFDQFDNAARMRRLGVGDVLEDRSLSGPNMAKALNALLHSKTVISHCREYAARLQECDPTSVVCDLLEGLLSSSATANMKMGGSGR